MLPELQKLVGFYRWTRAAYWECDTIYFDSLSYDCGYYGARGSYTKEQFFNKKPFIIGDLVDRDIVTTGGMVSIDDMDPKEMTVWEYHPLGHFKYSNYWDNLNGDPFNAWLDHKSHRQELLKNITVSTDPELKKCIVYSYTTINGMLFYIVDTELYSKSLGTSNVISKSGLDSLFKQDGAAYLVFFTGYEDDYDRLLPVSISNNEVTFDNVLFVLRDT
jgi:hypothetical protein